MLNAIKKARLIKGMKQKELAKAMGVTSVAVSNWELGKAMPGTEKLADLCSLLNLPVTELLTDLEAQKERRIG